MRVVQQVMIAASATPTPTRLSTIVTSPSSHRGAVPNAA